MSEPEPEHNADAPLVPLEERTVLFYEDEIKGVIIRSHLSEEPSIYVPVRPLCDFLGVAWTAQRRRLMDDPVLAQEVVGAILETPGGPQEMLCIPLDMLNGWLFSINANRVKEDIRDRLRRYQRECYRVLAAAFGATPQPPVVRGGLAEVEQLGYAIARLAREQMEFEARTDDHLTDHEERLTMLETRLADDATIDDAQAAQISQAVKAVAMLLGKKTGRNEFGGVYGELYRRFEVTSYKLLPRKRFNDAMAFLSEWYQELGGSVPF